MVTNMGPLKNPFRPGAGHMPPHLAGRTQEKREFERLLDQQPILQNVVLTGLRGVGKTVLLEALKPMAIARGWSWVGTDLSESTSVNEMNLAIRLLTDLSVVTSSVVIEADGKMGAGLTAVPEREARQLDFDTLMTMYSTAPGLTSDKLKHTLETVWSVLRERNYRGVIFAYDEAQNMSDRADKEQYPLSMLLDLFQSLQRRDFPYMLVLAGLPTLFPKLVEARTFAERMFHVITVGRLSENDSREAIVRPLESEPTPVTFSPAAVTQIYSITRGYPYFLQYVCREAFDIWAHQVLSGNPQKAIPRREILHKLDSDFFAGRWARATDRQRDLLQVAASLETASGDEFTVQEIVEQSSKAQGKPFKSSHANQLLSQLGDAGLVYKNRWGRYCFAVPLFDEFIKRQGKTV